jgi:hypothetical protein
MTETTTRYLSNFDAGDQEENNPKIMRIILSEQHVQIDFGYAAESIYFRGGWIRIAPYTYLQVKGSKIKYKLLDAKNIPIKPEHLHFESKQDWQVFSLFFEAIPVKKCVITIIEEEKPSSTDFNFYDIQIGDFIELAY